MRLMLCCFLALCSFVAYARIAQPPGPNCDVTQQLLASAEDRLQDWPQLGRYAAANGALPAPAAR